MKKKGVLGLGWAYSFLIIPILLQLIFFYFPMLQGFFYSFTDWTGLTSNFNFIGFDNFKEILTDEKLRSSIWFTVIFTVGLIVGEVVIGIFIARLLNGKLKASGFFRTVYFFPAVLSTVTLGLIFKQIFNYGLTQIGETLNIAFLQENLIANEKTAVIGVLFVALWQGIAIPVVIFLSGLQSIPKDVMEAAEIDGASSRQRFWNVEIPFLLPSISMVFILALKNGLTAFDLVYSLTGGGPSGKTTSVGLLVYNYAFKSNKFGYANAIAVVLFLVIGLISVLQIRTSRKFEV
ncbi:sugar ABC transporter permease [uncultured Enterococcus sp.]|uniref:carbohydrate ABC transporter permease n=1 Tax=uncultured Enterococcus sp. TaxID=167972 RepID=UPI002AA85290|nr:sugar ABC transporter permease [uncultured Enterococcus sp.]